MFEEKIKTGLKNIQSFISSIEEAFKNKGAPKAKEAIAKE